MFLMSTSLVFWLLQIMTTFITFYSHQFVWCEYHVEIYKVCKNAKLLLLAVLLDASGSIVLYCTEFSQQSWLI